MIERRQALLRTGEPPYRPIIRFLVQPDGQRSFYLAYPLFERLGIPMVRQNLERPEPEPRTRSEPCCDAGDQPGKFRSASIPFWTSWPTWWVSLSALSWSSGWVPGRTAA